MRNLVLALAGLVLASCATASPMMTDRVNHASDARPVDRSNDPTTGDLGVEANADGVTAKRNDRKKKPPTPGAESEAPPVPPSPPEAIKGP